MTCAIIGDRFLDCENSTRHCQALCFNLDCFIRIRLEKTGSGQQYSYSDLWDLQVSGEVEGSKFAGGVMKRSLNFSLPFDSQTFCDAFQLRDGAGTGQGTDKVKLLTRGEGKG